MLKIFVSYRRDDSEHITGRLYDRLELHFGRGNVFLDIDAIPFGVDFREQLDRAVGQCDVLLAVIGEQWLNIGHREGPKQGRRLDDPTDLVRIEIQSALARGIPVIPVLVGRAGMPGEQELPEGLKGLAFRHAAEVRSGRDFRDHVDRLIRGIEHLLRPKEGEAEGHTPGEDRPKPAEPRGKEPRPGEMVTNALGMKFAWIPPGTFLMGSPANEPERSDNETQHKVTLAKGFHLGIHQVTQAQWQAVMGSNPSHFKGDGNLPVENVFWEDCTAFCETLGKKDGKRYRLPTEAEWEYACRAGTTTPFHFDATISTNQANYNGNYTYGDGQKGVYRGETTPVGSFPANAWGLFDMHGNVWEWCADGYGAYETGDIADPKWFIDGEARVLRGGSWIDGPRRCRAACRSRRARPPLLRRRLPCRPVSGLIKGRKPPSMPTDPDAQRRRILSAGGPRTFQEFRRLLSPRVRALRGYLRETVACSPTFYAAVALGLNTIPDDYHDFLARNGRTVWMGDHLVNMDPSLKGQRPQGWPPGSTWAEVSGAYQHHHQRALLAERVADRHGTFHEARNVPATVREEIAHALDRALDQTIAGEGASTTEPDFVAAYQADDAALADRAARARLHYYLQAGAPGRRELFAQLFVIMGGVGLTSPHMEADLRAAFPNCLRVLPKILPSGTRGAP